MNTPEDILRSLRRWFGVALPPPWDVQFQRTEDTERPAAIVMPTPANAVTGSAYVRNFQRDYVAFLYPEGTEGEPAQGRIEAERVVNTIERAMNRGLPSYSRTMRLPAYDYDGIDWDDVQPDDAEPYDHLPVSNFGAEVRVDPDDDTLFTVVVTLRVQWHTLGDTKHLEGNPLQDVVVSHP